MRCPKCGFVEVTAGKTCRYCGSSLQQSILIPFPVTQATALTLTTDETQPDWRSELRERIQAIRARRGIAAALQAAARSGQVTEPKSEEPPKPINPIVEAALSRIRRAGNNEGKEPPLNVAAQGVRDEIKVNIAPPPPSIMFSTEAQGPAREPSPRTYRTRDEVTANPSFAEGQASAREPSLKINSTRGETPSRASLAYAETRPVEDYQFQVERSPMLAQAPGASSVLEDRSPQNGWQAKNSEVATWEGEDQPMAIDEASFEEASPELDAYAEPDHLATECEPAPADSSHHPSERAAEFRIRTATFLQRIRSSVIDALVLLLVTLPFAALVELNNGDFTDRRIQVVLGSIALMLYLLYMTVMLVKVGQTIGMMVTGIVAVDAQTLNLPSIPQAIRRALGSFLVAAPGLLGFFFTALDRQHRSISDLISGTTVKQAFEEIPNVHVPWLYHPVRS